MGRIVRRALVGAAVVSILVVGTASADRVYGDADTVSAGQQGTFDLGDLAPGAALSVPLDFQLTCGTTNTNHVDRGQTVTLTQTGGSMSGGSAFAESATIGPVPDTWPADGDWCSSQPPLVGSTTVTLVTPTATGSYSLDLAFTMTLAPAGHEDSKAFTGLPVNTAFATFTFTVVPNNPPSLTLPADLTVGATGPDGAVLTFAATATDAEDDPDPTVTCEPASGSLFGIGTTTVSCSATDTAGATVSGSFTVTVTPPSPPPTPTVTASFDPPVGPDGVLRVNGHRVVPVKARLASGGEAVRTGAVSLAVTACDATAGPDSTAMFPMAWQPGADRWMGLLSTALLPAGCFDVELVAAAAGSDGPSAAPAAAAADGGFTLWIDPPPSRGPKAR